MGEAEVEDAFDLDSNQSWSKDSAGVRESHLFEVIVWLYYPGRVVQICFLSS